ncbi:MAG: hypothetical protein LBJ31_11370 [Treponema sp.]|jgi:DNA-binding transcriptional regulator YiaG|nr:hypothetical protein [Treponema sp.]
MRKKYESKALMVCHHSAQELFKLGIIDTDEMREFDEGCLVHENKAVRTGIRSRPKTPAYAHGSQKADTKSRK